MRQGHQTNDPAMKCRMNSSDTALSHHYFRITQAQEIRQISPDTLSNNIGGVMQAFKKRLEHKHRQITLQENSRLSDCLFNTTESLALARARDLRSQMMTAGLPVQINFRF